MATTGENAGRASMEWVDEIEVRQKREEETGSQQGYCGPCYLVQDDVPKLIAAVRLADKKAYEALQHVVVGQRAIAMDQLDELVARLRSGEVEERVT